MIFKLMTHLNFVLDQDQEPNEKDTPLKPSSTKYSQKLLCRKKEKKGKRNSAKNIMKNLVFVGFIPDGAKSKFTTIKRLIRETNCAVVTMQETKCSLPFQINLDGYFTLEHLRSKKEGGGVAVSSLKVLKPVFVSDKGENVEPINIDILVKNMTVSVTSAYGQKETSKVEMKIMFQNYLNEEAQRSKACGKGYILQGDINVISGPELLPGDCHSQN